VGEPEVKPATSSLGSRFDGKGEVRVEHAARLERGTCRFEARSGRTTRTRTHGRLRAASLTCAARAFRASSTAFDHFRCSTGTRTGTSRSATLRRSDRAANS